MRNRQNKQYGRLIDLIIKNDPEEFQAYLEQHNFDITYRNHALLQVAARENNIAISTYLLNLGSDPSAGDPICEVAEAGYLKMAQLLLEHKASVVVQRNAPNEPLNSACSEGDFDMVKLLISYGATVSNVSFMWALYSDNLILVKYLYDMGGVTVENIDYAYEYADIPVLQFLYKNGFYPKKFNQIMMCFVRERGYRKMIWLANAFPDRKINKDRILQYALKWRETDTAFLLVDSFRVSIQEIADQKMREKVAKKVLEKHISSWVLRRRFAQYLEQKYAPGGVGYLEVEKNWYGV